jgi:transcriptional regulator with XRE-family HTH domain
MTPFNLKAARVNKGLSIAKCAETIGVDHRTYARLEAGTQVTPASAAKVAEYFGVQVTDLPAFADLQAAA